MSVEFYSDREAKLARDVVMSDVLSVLETRMSLSTVYFTPFTNNSPDLKTISIQTAIRAMPQPLTRFRWIVSSTQLASSVTVVTQPSPVAQRLAVVVMKNANTVLEPLPRN